MCPGRAPLGGGLEPGVCATATGLGRGLDGCEPEDLGLDSHRLEGLGRAPPVESRRTRRVVPHCGWSGSRRGLARPCGPEGLTLAREKRRSSETLEHGFHSAVVGDSSCRYSSKGLDWPGGAVRLAKGNVLSRAGSLWPPPPGWDGTGGLLRRSTCAGRRARASGLRQARHALPSSGRRCRRAAAGVELAVGLQGEGVHDSSAGRAC